MSTSSHDRQPKSNGPLDFGDEVPNIREPSDVELWSRVADLNEKAKKARVLSAEETHMLAVTEREGIEQGRVALTPAEIAHLLKKDPAIEPRVAEPMVETVPKGHQRRGVGGGVLVLSTYIFAAGAALFLIPLLGLGASIVTFQLGRALVLMTVGSLLLGIIILSEKSKKRVKFPTSSHV